MSEDNWFTQLFILIMSIPWLYGMATFVAWAYNHLPFSVVIAWK